jgi:hypothetical protein
MENAMLFYRATTGPREVSVPMIRMLTATSLVAYPLGSLTLALAPESLATTIAGFGLILLALACFVPLFGSSIQRVVGEETGRLDEYELRLRGRAMSLAYAIFSGSMLLAVLYSAIAADKGFWFPHTYEQFNGVLWGVFLYSSVLPAALLSWMVDPSFNQE